MRFSNPDGMNINTATALFATIYFWYLIQLK
jgi:hypothetical protein